MILKGIKNRQIYPYLPKIFLFFVSVFFLTASVSVTPDVSEQSQDVSDTVPHCTTAAPVSTVAPKETGISIQRFWVITKEQEVWLPGHRLSRLTVAAPQQVVLAVPGVANGVTFTGTHTVSC
jgi:hypothetical protein